MGAGFVRALPFGATLRNPELTGFRLWAPAQQSVSLEIEGRAAVSMTPQAEGWFEAEAGCGAGARYRYRLGSGLAVPDPAARAQAEDVHGPSLVVDPRAYRWKHPDWRGRPWRLRRRGGRDRAFRRARHHGNRADADQRFSRQAQLGL